jgi:hypothetical protein
MTVQFQTGHWDGYVNFNGTGISDASWGSNRRQFQCECRASKSLNSSGAINNGTGTLTVSGILNVTNAGSIAGTGGVTIDSGGTLLLGASEQIANTAPIRLAGGTISTGGFSETVGPLTLTVNSVLDCGNASSLWLFASSTGQNWTGGQLQIWNWSGSTAGGGTDRVFFGNSNSGLNTGQLQRIVFYSDAGAAPLGAATILPTGEIVPVPETSTIAGALALVGLVLCRERRRLIMALRAGR